jgi:hypothetical protein
MTQNCGSLRVKRKFRVFDSKLWLTDSKLWLTDSKLWLAESKFFPITITIGKQRALTAAVCPL